MLKKLVFLFCFVISFTLFADATDDKINQVKNDYSISGLSATVVKNGTVVFSRGYGKSNSIKNATGDTIYRIASISKSISAIALMQLNEQGKFRLDDDVSVKLGFNVRNPNFPNTKITYRHLLSHTSGMAAGDTYRLATEQSKSLSAELQNSANWTSNAPGSEFTYSNIGFATIGALIEKVSGEKFDEYCVNHIFKPLGLDASFNPGDIVNYQNIASLNGIDNYNGAKPSKILHSLPLGNCFTFAPQGGLRISTKDLGVIAQVLINKGTYNGVKILESGTVDSMEKVNWSGSLHSEIYKQKGLGIHITSDFVQNVKMYGHAGDAYGLLSDMYYNRDKNIAIIFALNGGTRTVGSSGYYKSEEKLASILYSAYANYTPVANNVEIVSIPSEAKLAEAVTIKGKVSGGLKKVQLVVDNLYNITGDAGVPVSNGEFSFSYKFSSPGNRSVVAKGFNDSNVEVAVSLPKIIIVKNGDTPPQVKIDFSVPANIKTGTEIEFKGTVTGNIVKIKRQLKNGEIKDAGNVSNGTFSFKILFDTAASKELTVFGFDAAGNQVDKVTKTFTVTSPATTFTKKVYDYVRVSSNYNITYATARERIYSISNSYSNMCATFSSTVLLNCGLDLTKWTQVTDGTPAERADNICLRYELMERGWTKYTDANLLQSGDIVFTINEPNWVGPNGERAPSHVYIFMEWINKPYTAKICDNNGWMITRNVAAGVSPYKDAFKEFYRK